MRTDSARIAAEAEAKVKDGLTGKHGEKYLGSARATKATPGAQDAHKAIRPTDVNRTPDSLREYLSADQYRLYDLCWRHFVASRMAPAVYDQTQAEIEGGDYVFRANGSVLAFDGFYKVWERKGNGKNELPDLSARVGNSPLTARLALDLAEPWSYEGELDASGLPCRDLLALIPHVPAPVRIAGTIAGRVEARGTFRPWRMESSGQARIDHFQVDRLPIGDLPIRWTTQGETIAVAAEELERER